MAKNYIYSTMSCDVIYTVGDPRNPKNILVRGGANVQTKYMETPAGVATELTDEEVELLTALPEKSAFKIQMKEGYLKIDSKKDANKAASDMKKKDKAAALTKEDCGKTPEVPLVSMTV